MVNATSTHRQSAPFYRALGSLFAGACNGEAAGDPAIMAFTPCATAINSGPTGIQVDHKAAAPDAVLALVQFNPAQHGDDAAVQVINGKIAVSLGLRTVTPPDASRRSMSTFPSSRA